MTLFVCAYRGVRKKDTAIFYAKMYCQHEGKTADDVRIKEACGRIIVEERK